MQCSTCGITLSPGMTYCSTCGSRAPAPPPAPEKPPPSQGTLAPRPAAGLATGRAVVGPENSTAAVVSVAMGVTSWFMLPLVGGLVAVIAGHMAKKEIRQSGGMVGGDRLATAGLVLGYTNMILVCLAPCALLAIFGSLAAFVEAMN
jgi:hypothetical protein